MQNSVLQTICEYGMLVRGERVVCATSGGADSVAMLRALCILKDRLEITVFACHLNHGLRGEESERDEAFVRDLCEKLNVPLHVEKTKIEGKSGVEERAREARYAFYRRALEHFKAQKIATAHNAEDNLETLIFRLARGTGLDGLRGIPPVRDNIVRPLIFTTKAQILKFLNEIKQDWVEDSSNASDDYTRNLIRHKILPVLSTINGEASSNCARTIKNISADCEYLNRVAEEYKCCEDWIDTDAAKLPNPILSRIIRNKCEEIVKNKKQVLDFDAVCDIIDLIRGDKPRGGITVSRDLQVVRHGDKVYFVKPEKMPEERVLKANDSIIFGDFKITCLKGEITVRPRRDGDKIKLEGRRTRLVKKILCDAKIPAHLRDLIPIIEKEGKITALCGFGFAEGEDKGCVLIENNA